MTSDTDGVITSEGLHTGDVTVEELVEEEAVLEEIATDEGTEPFSLLPLYVKKPGSINPLLLTVFLVHFNNISSTL